MLCYLSELVLLRAKSAKLARLPGETLWPVWTACTLLDKFQFFSLFLLCTDYDRGSEKKIITLCSVLQNGLHGLVASSSLQAPHLWIRETRCHQLDQQGLKLT